MLIVIFDAGALQRAEEVEEDRKDSLVAHLDSGRFFFHSHSVIPVLLQPFIQPHPPPKVPRC
jgi:hypothetical protein